MEKINRLIIAKQDLKYREFIHRLTPTLPISYFIGVKTPELKKILKLLCVEDKEEFIKELPHKYYEENMLHGFIISEIKDYDKAIKELDRFLPFVNNWATSDTMYPKIFKKHTDKLLNEIEKWISNGGTYHVRFGVDMLMTFYLDEHFDEKYLEIVKNIHSDEYYINMMLAWYYSVALMKQWDSAIKVIESKTLDKWIHNKSIQKALESNRISEQEKDYLRSLKIK